MLPDPRRCRHCRWPFCRKDCECRGVYRVYLLGISIRNSFFPFKQQCQTRISESLIQPELCLFFISHQCDTCFQSFTLTLQRVDPFFLHFFSPLRQNRSHVSPFGGLRVPAPLSHRRALCRAPRHSWQGLAAAGAAAAGTGAARPLPCVALLA